MSAAASGGWPFARLTPEAARRLRRGHGLGRAAAVRSRTPRCRRRRTGLPPSRRSAGPRRPRTAPRAARPRSRPRAPGPGGAEAAGAPGASGQSRRAPGSPPSTRSRSSSANSGSGRGASALSASARSCSAPTSGRGSRGAPSRASSIARRSRSRVLSGEFIAGLPQLRDGSVQTGAHVGLGGAEHARDLGVREAAGELERHEVAVAGVEGGERGADDVALERELGLLVRTRQGAVLGLVRRAGRGACGAAARRGRRCGRSRTATPRWCRAPRGSSSACGRRARTPGRSRPRRRSGRAGGTPRSRTRA